MSVFELKATNRMSDKIAVPETVKSAPGGRSWGKVFLWSAIALVVAGALAGGGWLAFRAGQQSGNTGGAVVTERNVQLAPVAQTGSNGAVQTSEVSVAPRKSSGKSGEQAASASSQGGGLSSLIANAAAPAAALINIDPDALEQSTTRVEAVSDGVGATASIPVVVAKEATPLLSDAGSALASLDSGDPLRATSRSADGEWLSVESDAASGWVARDALIAYGIGNLATRNPPAAVIEAVTKPAQSAKAETMTLVATGPDTSGAEAPASALPPAVNAIVNTSAANLNVRTGSGTQYAIVATAAKGATLTPTARNAAADWLKVNLATGESGWAAALFLNVNGDVQSLPVETSSAVPLPAAPSSDSTAAANAAAVASSVDSSSNNAAAAIAAADSLSGTLAFQQSPGGMIWTYDFASGETRSLTEGFDPAISPDGSTVAFVREGGEAGIYLINSDGTNERMIFNQRGRLSAPKWSDDGQWILFGRGDEGYVCYPMGPACLTEDELKARSPHGTPLSLPSEYRYFDKLSVVDRDGNNFHDIPSLTSAKAADWANGDVVYQSSAGLRRTQDGPSDSDQLVIFLPLEQQFQDPDWQPGGNEIVFQQKGTTQRDIWAVNADGSNLHGLTQPVTTLVQEMPSNVAPAFSPEGAHIVYLSNRTESETAGAWRLWVMDADGSNQRPLNIDVPIDYAFGVEQVVSWGG